MNQLNGVMEVSGAMPSESSSVSFFIVFISTAVKFVLVTEECRCDDEFQDDDDFHDDDFHDDDFHDDEFHDESEIRPPHDDGANVHLFKCSSNVQMLIPIMMTYATMKTHFWMIYSKKRKNQIL